MRRSDTVANACLLLSLGECVGERHLLDSGVLLYFQRMQLPWLMPYLRFWRGRLSLEVEEMCGGGIRVVVARTVVEYSTHLCAGLSTHPCPRAAIIAPVII